MSENFTLLYEILESLLSTLVLLLLEFHVLPHLEHLGELPLLFLLIVEFVTLLFSLKVSCLLNLPNGILGKHVAVLDFLLALVGNFSLLIRARLVECLMFLGIHLLLSRFRRKKIRLNQCNYINY